MHQPIHARFARASLSAALVAALLLPALPAAAADGDPLILRAGTTQDLDSINPFATALVVGYEVMTLNYELLVGFGQNLEPVPSFAESWTPNADQTEWTFKIPAGKQWSDGQPATSEDVRWTYQLVLDAVSEGGDVGLGYLDQYVENAAVESIAAPDPQTVVFTLSRANDRLLQSYIPILPKHEWEDQTLETIGDYKNEPPIVGSGPYQATEWKTGESITFAKNENFVGETGAADEVIIQIFESADTMVQSLQSGDLDYARGVNADQFDALQGVENITTVEAKANGFTELGFNTYGTGTGKTISGGGPSTQALLDPAFRDALGYAVDKSLLVDRVLGGYGVAGTTQVPPFQVNWHTPPAAPRTFDLAVAAQKLDAAGYPLVGGKRMDKQNKEIVLELVFPDSEAAYPQAAEFISEWWRELGITVNAQQYDSDTLIDKMLPPEADPDDPTAYTADYDLFIWGWGGDVDPNSLLAIFKCDEIGNLSDSMYCNERYDELFKLQNEAPTAEERKTYMDEMQQIMYDEAPYHILFYDAQLDAYRTDRFSGWQNQPPEDGTPLFAYGPLGYTLLTDAAAPQPTPSAVESGQPAPTGAVATPAPTGGGQAPTGSGGNTGLIIGVIAAIAVLAVGFLFLRRRGARVEEE